MTPLTRQDIGSRNLTSVYNEMMDCVHPDVIVHTVPFYPGSNRLFEDRTESFLSVYGIMRWSCRYGLQHGNLGPWHFPPA